MAWAADMTTVLRVLVDDMDETKYTDAKLQTMLVVAAFQVKNELTFAQTYTISLSAETISPDPTDSDTADESFVNLVTLKAACITDKGSAITAANRAIAVKDDTSSIDLRGVLEGKLALLKQGWCAAYADAKFEYQSNRATAAGAAILSPFRLYANNPGFQSYFVR